MFNFPCLGETPCGGIQEDISNIYNDALWKASKRKGKIKWIKNINMNYTEIEGTETKWKIISRYIYIYVFVDEHIWHTGIGNLQFPPTECWKFLYSILPRFTHSSSVQVRNSTGVSCII